PAPMAFRTSFGSQGFPPFFSLSAYEILSASSSVARGNDHVTRFFSTCDPGPSPVDLFFLRRDFFFADTPAGPAFPSSSFDSAIPWRRSERDSKRTLLLDHPR